MLLTLSQEQNNRSSSSLTERVFIFDTVNKKILYPSGFAGEYFPLLIEHLSMHYAEQWQKCLQLQAGGEFGFQVVDATFLFPFEHNKLHVVRMNDNDRSELLCIISNGIESGTEIEKMHERYEAERSDFFDLALHELQSPVRKLSTLLERLFMQPEVQESVSAKPFIERVKLVSAQLNSLTNGLNSLYETNADNTELENCNLNAIVNTAANEVRELTGNNAFELQMAKLPVVHGNFKQLKILFINLFQNAIKFCEPGKPCTVEITTAPFNEEEISQFANTKTVYHKMKVTDNGIGFNIEQAEKIFEPFVRLNGKSAYEGNGLGLAVCKKIVDNHKGRIYAEAKPGEGCTVYVILPENINL